MCKSVPQMPVAFTLTSTSLAPTAGTGTSTNSSPGPGCVFTRAFTGRLPQRHTATRLESEPRRTISSDSSSAPCASGEGPLRERRRGADDECRSDERDTLFVSRRVTNESASSAPCASATPKNG